LLLRFRTIEAGEVRRLLLNLRKGYFKHGDIFGTKVYLSQVQEVILDELDVMRLGGAIESSERVSSSDEEGGHASSSRARVNHAPAARFGARVASRHERVRRRADRFADGGSTERRAGPVRLILSAIRGAQKMGRFITGRGIDPGEADDASDVLYSVIVHAKTTSGWKWMFGLTSRSQTVVLDFRRPDERARFISFVEALLPPTSASPPATRPHEPSFAAALCC
jgi:hypothetical protein